MPELRIGVSGWRYKDWRRGVWYPEGLVQRTELAYTSRQLNTIEINGSFYSLQRPESYLRWRAETPDDFVFALKGGRFITHMKKLREVEQPLANFFASGVLALGRKLGPILWQLPEMVSYDPGRMKSFFDLLPRTAGAAAALAQGHGPRLEGRAWLDTDAPEAPLRHAFEVRHSSFFDGPAFGRQLAAEGFALVIADSAGRWHRAEEITADFAYLRLHGCERLYTGEYPDAELDRWARLIRAWAAEGRDAYAYFDNDIGGYAPHDAKRLASRLGL